MDENGYKFTSDNTLGFKILTEEEQYDYLRATPNYSNCVVAGADFRIPNKDAPEVQILRDYIVTDYTDDSLGKIYMTYNTVAFGKGYLDLTRLLADCVAKNQYQPDGEKYNDSLNAFKNMVDKS